MFVFDKGKKNNAPEPTIELIIDAPLYVIKKACSREEQTQDLIKRLVE